MNRWTNGRPFGLSFCEASWSLQFVLSSWYNLSSCLELPSGGVPIDSMKDFFISHATEDKDEIARPLAEALRNEGFSVWYDEYTLTLGDHLRRKIDKGLETSRYGLVILSPYFFAKQWPQHELDTLLDREIHERRKLIMPIWHKIDKDDVAGYSSSLAMRYAVRTSDGLATVITYIKKAVESDEINENKIEELATKISLDEIRWDKVANLWWLSHDLVELFRWLLSGVSKQWIDIGFKQTHHHADELRLDESIVGQLRELRDIAYAIPEGDWTPQKREEFAVKVKVIFNAIAQITEKHQRKDVPSGFKSSPD